MATLMGRKARGLIGFSEDLGIVETYARITGEKIIVAEIIDYQAASFLNGKFGDGAMFSHGMGVAREQLALLAATHPLFATATVTLPPTKAA